ncbi:MAG TPA: dihydrolipoamide acetyltransferase family protein [Bacillota bacterium]
MAFEFKLPDVGEGIHEGEIVRWLVAEGDQVAEDQPLVEVQTDKAVVEIPSPVQGSVLKLHYKEGDVVDVGSVIITIGTAGEAPAVDGAQAPTEAAAPSTGSAAVAASYRAGSEGSTTAPAAAPAAAPADQAPAPAAGGPNGRRRALATPATRRLARELGVDINRVQGTGPGGRVTDDDVRAFAEGRQPAAAGPAAPQPIAPAPAATAPEGPRPAPALQPVIVTGETPEERIPLRGLRRTIAERMVKSMYTAPHVTHMDEVDVTELVALRRKARAAAEARGVKLTYLPFIAKALIAALREFPYLNATLDDERQEIVLKRYYHIGIATDTDDGLIVPVVKHADRKSILQIAAEIEFLADRARQRKVDVDDLRGGTFTITNIGALGGIFSTPVINHPEVAILGVHKIQEKPVVRDGEIVVRSILPLALSFDHRVVDGAYAARFLNRVMAYLEQPDLLFMEMV